jgi:uncharacterized protein
LDPSLAQTILLASLIFLVAALYSSVGHGGASGYLAVLALFSVPPQQMAGTALILNIVVAGLASYAFLRAGYFSPRLFWPFAAASIPLSFIGGMIKISDHLFYLLLGFALLAAAFRLWLSLKMSDTTDSTKPARIEAALPVGAGVGLLSGMLGIGGGIFLSPLMLLLKWATAKQSAAVAAVFILVNSLSGLAGRVTRGGLDIHSAFIPLCAAGLGGLLGSHFGAQRFTNRSLRRALAMVLALAAIKLVVAAP